MVGVIVPTIRLRDFCFRHHEAVKLHSLLLIVFLDNNVIDHLHEFLVAYGLTTEPLVP